MINKLRYWSPYIPIISFIIVIFIGALNKNKTLCISDLDNENQGYHFGITILIHGISYTSLLFILSLKN